MMTNKQKAAAFDAEKLTDALAASMIRHEHPGRYVWQDLRHWGYARFLMRYTADLLILADADFPAAVVDTFVERSGLSSGVVCIEQGTMFVRAHQPDSMWVLDNS